MNALITQHWHLAWMAVAALTIAWLGSPRFRGKRASERVRRLLQQSPGKHQFTQFHGLRFPAGEGSDELDHVLISQFGVFVIVSEYHPGTISGGEAQELWKQQRFGRTRHWPNPLHRAKLHAETLRDHFDIPSNKVYPLVVIDGQQSITENLPSQVLRVEQLVPYLRKQTQQLFTAEQADRLSRAVTDLALPKKRKFSASGWLRIILALAIAFGIYHIYGQDIKYWVSNFSEQVEKAASPQNFNAAGERKSPQQIYEDSLVCAYSTDTERCACYEPGGEKVAIEAERCKALAERGSVLNQ